MTDQMRALSREWNDAGRRLATDVQVRLERFHKGEVDDPELPSDPRDEALAARVLDAVLELNQLGRWQEARRWFDPAHEPFIPRMGDDGLHFVVALGEDEALFRRGCTNEHGHLWRVAGDSLTPLPELSAAAISPNREMLALADAGGVRVLRGWNGSEVARFPWPSRDELVPPWVPGSARDRYDVESPGSSLLYLCVANSGLRIAIALQSGVAVGDVSRGAAWWHLALPLEDQADERVLEELKKGERSGFYGIGKGKPAANYGHMVHVAMSGDGRFLACGSQREGHHLFTIDPDGRTSFWAKLGPASEYPHNACFSRDGTRVAFNACQFYSGATIAADTHAIKGAVTEPYEEDARAPVINRYLRVYASTWLPESALPDGKAAFALAGLSFLTIVTHSGEVLHELMFGSSASGIDYCPTTKTLVLGSYSGFLHFLKPTDIDAIGLGWRPPRELKRWCFLKDLPPFQW
jgi:hypothetical protein